MAERSLLSALRFFRSRGRSHGCREEKTTDNWAETRCGQREWEELYRRRWQYDKKVRSTHGVNCTGSCSWRPFCQPAARYCRHKPFMLPLIISAERNRESTSALYVPKHLHPPKEKPAGHVRGKVFMNGSSVLTRR